MYTPAVFREEDPRRIWDFVAANPFAILVSQDEAGAIAATHLVFRAIAPEAADGRWRLQGHLARENAHGAALARGGESLAIFHGPHAFISPGWYQVQPSVPTWNYAAVHVRGPVRVIEDEAGRDAAMAALVAGYDTQGWRYEALPAGYKAKMLAGIVLFELEAVSVTAKWKMSQNRAPKDRVAVAQALAAQGPAEAEVAALVRATLPKPA